MSPSTIQFEILETAVEDFYGLWEVVWGLHNLLPDSGESGLRSVAEREIRELLAKGWVSLFRRNGAEGEERPLPPDEVESAVLDQKNWEEPKANSMQILIGATEEGERVYYSWGTGP